MILDVSDSSLSFSCILQCPAAHASTLFYKSFIQCQTSSSSCLKGFWFFGSTWDSFWQEESPGSPQQLQAARLWNKQQWRRGTRPPVPTPRRAHTCHPAEPPAPLTEGGGGQEGDKRAILLTPRPARFQVTISRPSCLSDIYSQASDQEKHAPEISPSAFLLTWPQKGDLCILKAGNKVSGVFDLWRKRKKQVERLALSK